MSGGRRRFFPSKRQLRSLALSILLFLLLTIVGGLSLYLYQLYTGGNRGEEGVGGKGGSTTSIEEIRRKEQEVLRAVLSEVEDYRKNLSSSSPTPPASSGSSSSAPPPPPPPKRREEVKRESHPVTPKGTLAIIIDDVAFDYQVRALQSLKIPINLSFFPPNSRHPHTARYARRLRHYMIHLPLEAVHFRREEENTLRTESSLAEMERVVQKLREQFPRARYINNHTGSKFTADRRAMKRLISVLDRYGFRFIDSRTTPQTQVPAIMGELGRPYIHRDIFLDNVLSLSAIKGQIRKAVAIARKRGFAIAIGHPHAKTIRALRESKEILKKVKLIYIDEL
ncbi:MAG: divergent polysaccharide deacetylase family protein [Epsilonproteobacteria bacterium]|nr:divergent polysaccharide deacetylase family protein [Campylobacterota bacterium]NPA56636.1 divergent polysaccharide deacetylase family protein [Campylobacterota bacterium]